ncbi:MAG: site-specific integrase [Oscillatoriales cyanobacterium]|nr:MAG: site-specific integrase [Oscillatoriales cyanobacterium]
MKDIIPKPDKGAIRLRFAIEGRNFAFYPLPKGRWEDKRDRQIVASIGVKIQNDILAGNFDPSLERYRHRVSPQQTSETVEQKPTVDRWDWLRLWDTWVASLDLPISTAADHYACVRAMLVKAGNPSLKSVEWLQLSELAASTFNRRLSMLRSCLLWAIDEDLIKENPLKKIRSRTMTEQERQSSDEKKAPFSDLEIQRILNYIDRCHPTYAPFVRFLLFSGVRTGEAVGLTWENIDLEKRLIFIRQSVSRERGGYKKIRKNPKTRDSVRTLKMSNRIFDVLSAIAIGCSCDLIFKSPMGQVIDHGNFRTQCWKRTLRALDIPYRKPYATRHTLLSQALESGLSVPQVAQIAGHRDGKMILQHYGHVINQPQLPE